MNKNYWHIQLHPDERSDIETIKSILTKKKVIGMGDSWNDKSGKPVNDPKWFKYDMKIGDVVMVRDGSTPVALVEVTGNAYVEPNIDKDFDWFALRRKIDVLGFYGDKEKRILNQILTDYGKNHIQAPGTLTCCNGSNATNDFIVEWNKIANYKKLMANIKLSPERQTQIKALWEKYKNEIKQEDKDYSGPRFLDSGLRC